MDSSSREESIKGELQYEFAQASATASVSAVALHTVFLLISPFSSRPGALWLAISLYAVLLLRYFIAKKRMRECGKTFGKSTCEMFMAFCSTLIMAHGILWGLSLQPLMANLFNAPLESFEALIIIAGLTGSAASSIALHPTLMIAFCLSVIGFSFWPLLLIEEGQTLFNLAIITALYCAFLIRQSLSFKKQTQSQVESKLIVEDQNDSIQAILRSVPAAIALVKSTSGIEFSNLRFRDTFGVDLKQLDKRLIAFVRKFIRSSKQSCFFENRIATMPIGEKRWHVVHIERIGGDTAICVAIDVHEQKALEAEMAEDKRRLERSSKMSMIGQMVGGVAHEINNPLAIIMGSADSLKRNLAKKNIDKQKLEKSSDLIFQTCERIAGIVRSLKVLSRDDSGAAEMGWFSLEKIWSETLSLIEGKLLIDNVNLEVSELPNAEILCNSSHLVLVCMNLLSNAVDAMGSHGGLSEKRIWVDFRRSKKGLFVHFRDSGPGVPQELRAKIFDPFFTTKDPSKGTGLGLSLVNSYLMAMGAEIELHPEFPSEFIIKIPKSHLRFEEINNRQAA